MTDKNSVFECIHATNTLSKITAGPTVNNAILNTQCLLHQVVDSKKIYYGFCLVRMKFQSVVVFYSTQPDRGHNNYLKRNIISTQLTHHC